MSVNTYICYSALPVWRQSMFWVFLGTMISISLFISEYHWKPTLLVFPPNTHTRTHTNACPWHTVVVHCSFIHEEGFILGLVQHHSSAHSLLACHSLRDLPTTSPQLWLCNTLTSFKPKVVWASFQPPCVTSRHWTAFLWLYITDALCNY